MSELTPFSSVLDSTLPLLSKTLLLCRKATQELRQEEGEFNSSLDTLQITHAHTVTGLLFSLDLETYFAAKIGLDLIAILFS